MNNKQLKIFLDSLVTEKNRDFVVEISERVNKRRRGVYIAKRKMIRIYGGVRQEPIWLVMVGIHELAHHLNYKSCRESWHCLRQAGKRVPYHGRVFRITMKRLLRQVNTRYGKVLGGMIVFDRRRFARPPRFKKFDKTNNYQSCCNERKENYISFEHKRSPIQAIRRIAKKRISGEIEGVLLDVSAAQAIMRVYAALNRLHKRQFAEMGILTQFAVAVELLAKHGAEIEQWPDCFSDSCVFAGDETLRENG